jgi:hypothetical protein
MGAVEMVVFSKARRVGVFGCLLAVKWFAGPLQDPEGGEQLESWVYF